MTGKQRDGQMMGKGPPNALENGNLVDQKRAKVFDDWVAANYDGKILQSAQKDTGLRDELQKKFEAKADQSGGRNFVPDKGVRGDSVRKQVVRQQTDGGPVENIRGDSARKR